MSCVPLPMVEIDVEHRYFLRTVVAQPLRRDGGIVDEAIAAEEIEPGMMAGRAAEREGIAIAGMEPISPRQRAAHRRERRFVGALGDRGIGGVGIMADHADDVFRHALAGAPHRKGSGDRLPL